VDEWREMRELTEAELRYLVRLDDDLEASITRLRQHIENFESNRKRVRYVNDSFAAGRIPDDDPRMFELGLIYVSHLPSIGIQRSA
jgi:hypothetical protein